VLKENLILGFSKALGKEVKIEAAVTKPFLRGKQIRRYEPPVTNSCLICPYEIKDDTFRLLTASEMHSNYPLTMGYLEDNKGILIARDVARLNPSFRPCPGVQGPFPRRLHKYHSFPCLLKRTAVCSAQLPEGLILSWSGFVCTVGSRLRHQSHHSAKPQETQYSNQRD